MKNSEIVVYIIAAAGILGAVIAFLKTPKEQRFRLSRPNKEDGIGYAPQYTERERIKLVIKFAAILVPFSIVYKFWFLPWLSEYASKAHCYNYGSYTGTHILFYSLFVGMPLLFALILLALFGLTQLKAFKLGQYPPPNQKVLSPTKYVYGIKAKLRSILFFGCILFLIGLSIRGYYWANNIIELPIKDTTACVDN